MSEKELIKQIRKLPTEAQQEAADFVEFLSKKYIRKPEETDFLRKNPSLKIHSEEFGDIAMTFRTVRSGYGSFVKAVGQTKKAHGSVSSH